MAIFPYNNTASVSLNGSASGLCTAVTSVPVTGSFLTLEFWFNPNVVMPNNAVWGLITKDRGYWMDVYNPSNSPVLRIGMNSTGSPANYMLSQLPYTVPPNVWNHVAVVFDFTQATRANKLKMYVNGSLQSLTTADAGVIPSIVSNFTNIPLCIGNYYAPTNAPANAKFDEVRVWNTARTQAEIMDNMSRELAGNESGLIAYYALNNSYLDGTSNAYNLTTLSGNSFTSNVPFPQLVTAIGFGGGV
jgi:hypothetical protein